MGLLSSYKALSRWQKLFAWTVLLLILYTVFGFLIFPVLVQKIASDKLTVALNRTTTVEKVTFNPYTLFLSLEGFRILEKDSGTSFCTLERAHVDMQASSLFRRGAVIREILVDGLELNLVRKQDYSYNISDLIASGQSDKETDKGSFFRFSVSNIMLENSSVILEDQLKDKTHTFSDINIALPFLSNMAVHSDIFVTPRFSVRINGAPVELAGQTKPFTDKKVTRMNFSLKDIDLPVYYAYVPADTNMQLVSGTLDLSCHVEFEFPDSPGKMPELFLSGELDVQNFAIDTADAGPLLNLDKLNMVMARSNILKGNIVLEDVTVSSPRITLVRDEHKVFNIQNLMPEKGKSEPGDAIVDAEESQAAPAFDIQLECGRIAMTDAGIILVDVQNEQMLFSLPVAMVEDLAMETGQKKVSIGKAAFDDGRLNVYRMADDVLNLLVFSGEKKPVRDSASDPEASLPGWTAQLDSLALNGFAVDAQDLAGKGRGSLSIQDLTLTGQKISNNEGQLADAGMSFGMNKDGRVELEGSLGLVPLDIDTKIQVDRIRLDWFQPFISNMLNVIVSGGTVSTTGQVVLQVNETGGLKPGFKGDISVSEFKAMNSPAGDDLAGFGRLDVKNLALEMNPLTAEIDTISLEEPVSQLLVYPDGSLNYSQIFKPTSEKAGNDQDPAAADKSGSGKIPLEIGQVVIKDGQLDILDRSITPHLSAGVTQIHAGIKGLSARETVQSDLNISAVVNNHTPVTIEGKINPLKEDFFCDMDITCSGLDLGFLSPYAGKYAGYKIQRGKMTLDLSYLVDQRKLESRNKLYLDQFDFGKKVKSEYAIDAPVTLAVALLKDPSGMITLDLPVNGSLDDPEFSVTGIVIKMIVNLLVKAATAPFSLLGAMFGGGEDLNVIAFEPGDQDLTPQAREKTETLATALSQRPALKLEIQGFVDIDKDRRALEQSAFNRRLKAMKLTHMVEQGLLGIPLDEISLTEEEYKFFLAAAYTRTQEGQRLAEMDTKGDSTPSDDDDIDTGPAEPETAENLPDSEKHQLPPVDQMVRAVMDSIQITDDDLRQLAAQRSMAVKDAILSDKQIDPGRVFILQPGGLEPENYQESEDTGIVQMSLK